jgi:chromosome segregation ATPase
MSKKIAQLTKVIYHLNTRNEDHQIEMDTVVSNHQAEVDHILRDASAKMKKLQETMESKQMQANLEAEITRLKKRHETERTTAVNEFHEYKQKMAKREEDMTFQYQEKFEAIKNEIARLNNNFAGRIKDFNEMNENLRGKLEAAAQDTTEADAMQMKYEAETKELVRMNNEKYQAMMIHQLALQEEVKKEAEMKYAAQKAEDAEKFAEELKTQCGQLRAQLGAEKQEELMSMKRDYEKQLSAQRDDLMGKLERALADLKDLAEKNRNLESELQRQVEEVAKNLGDQLGSRESDMKQLKIEVSSLSEKLRERERQLSASLEESIALKDKLDNATESLNTTEASLRGCEIEISRLNDELARSTQTGAGMEQQLRGQLAIKDKECASLRSDVNNLGTQINTLRNDLKSTQMDSGKALKDLQATYDALKIDKETLENRLKQVMDGNKAIEGKSANAVALLQQKLGESEIEWKKQMSAKDEVHKRTMEALADKHQNSLDTIEEAKAKAVNEAMDKMATLEEQHAADREKFAKELAEASEAAEREKEGVRVEHATQVEALQSKISALLQEMSDSSSQAAGDKGHLQEQIAQLQATVQSMQSDIENKRSDIERLTGNKSSLKEQVDDLTDRLEAQRKAYETRMENSLANQGAEWTNKLDSMIAHEKSQHEQAFSDMKAKLENEMEMMRNSHSMEIDTLKDRAKASADAAGGDLDRLQKAYDELADELSNARKAHSEAVDEMKLSHANDLQSLEDRLRGEKESSQKSWDDEKSEMQSRYEEELLALKTSTKRSLDDAKTKMDKFIEESKKAAEAGLSTALTQLTETLQQQKNEELRELNNRNSAAVAQMVDDHEQIMKSKSAELQQSNGDRDKFMKSYQESESMLNSERERARQAEMLMAAEKDEMSMNYATDLRREQESSERHVKELMAKHNYELETLQQEYADERARIEESVKGMAREYAMLETRYKNRESRPEDVDRIQYLEQALLEREEYMHSMEEQLGVIKREMLNREENYNQKFARAPNVGVMQVIKNPAGAKDTPSMLSQAGENILGGKLPGNKPRYGVGKSGPSRTQSMDAGYNGLSMNGAGGTSSSASIGQGSTGGNGIAMQQTGSFNEGGAGRRSNGEKRQTVKTRSLV